MTDFYLCEEARGRGIGSEALALITRGARKLELKAIELVVVRHKGRGRSFHERNGFHAMEGRTPMLKLL